MCSTAAERIVASVAAQRAVAIDRIVAVAAINPAARAVIVAAPEKLLSVSLPSSP